MDSRRWNSRRCRWPNAGTRRIASTPFWPGGPEALARRQALFVVNPALSRTGPRFGARLVKYAATLGWDSSVLETSPGLNVEAIGGALARGTFDVLLAAGGDGTVAEVMAAAHLRGLPIGIVPRGTANIVAP
ncbi:MAG TPA: acylglycerol kinase family protein, partial [Candidatus Dormibacteraeota bacterium]